MSTPTTDAIIGRYLNGRNSQLDFLQLLTNRGAYVFGWIDYNGFLQGSLRSTPPQAYSINATLSVTDNYVRAVGGSGGIVLTLPSSSNGLPFTIKKVDSGVGSIQIVGTVDDNPSGYVLVNQYQYVSLINNGLTPTSFDIIGGN